MNYFKEPAAKSDLIKIKHSRTPETESNEIKIKYFQKTL